MPIDVELEKKTFPNGRHRNKTYLWVFENDTDFCQMVMNGEKSRFIPEDFSHFLCTKIKHFSPQPLIAAPHGRAFVQALDENLRRQFRSIVGDLDIINQEIHSPCTYSPTNYFYGVFYPIFVQKHVANLTNTDGYRRYFQCYAAIFPFPVSDLVAEHETDIFNVIEDELELLDEMQAFLNEHFDNVEIRSVCKKLFDNILNSKQNNVSEQTILEAVKDLDLRGLSADRGDKNSSCIGNENSEYLKNFPRLNDDGVLRYQKMYNMILRVTQLYKKPCNVPAFKYETNYLLKLAEINLYELYSLLNVDFFHSDREEYVNRLKKYLFFFINALNNPPSPVFFIDDGLFECLLHYNTFRKSRDDVEKLTFELSMVTLVYCRKLILDRCIETFRLENSNLRDVKNYLNNFPDISNALVKHELSTEVMHSTAHVSTERVAMNVCFQNRFNNSIIKFYTLIIYGALSPSNIEHLVIYNAFTGREERVSMPSNKHDVIEFIRKHNNYDFTRIQTRPPERFITAGLELFFEGHVAKWDSREHQWRR